MRSRLGLFVLGLCVAFSPAVRAGDAMNGALASIPADVVGFVCIPSLQQLDSDYQQAVLNLGLQPFVPPPWNSPVAVLKQKLPMLEGIDEKGSVALVFMPAETVFELQMKQALLIPAKDPKAMIETMGGQAGEGGLWVINMMGQPSHAAIRGKQVIIAAQAEVAKALKETQTSIAGKLKPADLKALQGQDLVVWVDGDRLFKLLKPMVDGILVPMMMAQAGGGGFNAKSAEMNKKNMDMFFEGAASMSLGLALDGEGVGLRWAMTSKPGTELAKRTKMKNTDGSLLSGLPSAKYMAAFGQTVDPVQVEASFEQIDSLFSMADEVEEIDQEKLEQLKGILKEMLPMITGGRGMVEGLAPGPDGLFGASLVIDTTDGKKWLEQVGKLVDLAEQMLADAAKHETADEDFKKWSSNIIEALSFDSEAEEVAGVKVGHFKFDLTKIEDIDEEDLEDVTKVIGQDGVLLRMAPVDARTVAIGFGGGKTRMGTLIEQAKKKEAPLDGDAGIKKVAAFLPEKRASVAYVAVDQILAFIPNVMKALGEEEVFPVQMPKIDAPLAMAASGGDGWMQLDMFLPTELLVASKDAGMMMAGSMMAPPPPTTPPPAPPEEQP